MTSSNYNSTLINSNKDYYLLSHHHTTLIYMNWTDSRIDVIKM